MYVYYKNRFTGKVKRVKRGYSWTTMLFGCLPAFCRGDFKWGLISLLVATIISNLGALIVGSTTMNIITGILWILWGFKYNEIYEQELIIKGYEVME